MDDNLAASFGPLANGGTFHQTVGFAFEFLLGGNDGDPPLTTMVPRGFTRKVMQDSTNLRASGSR